MFVTRNFKQHREPSQTVVAATLDRNAENWLRVQNINDKLILGAASFTNGDGNAHGLRDLLDQHDGGAPVRVRAAEQS